MLPTRTLESRRRFVRRQVRYVEDVADDLMVDHQLAMVVRDLEDVLKTACSVVNNLERFQVEIFESLHLNEIADIEELGDDVERHFEIAVTAFRKLGLAITLAENLNFEVDGKASFLAAFDLLQCIQKRQKQRWPRINPDELRKALESEEEGVDAEDLLRELQGQDS